MKKLISILLTSCLIAGTVFAADPVTRQNEDGTVSIIAVDKDASVKTKQKVDGFKDVTVITGKKVTKQNPVTIDLSAFGGKEVFVSLSCEIKIDDPFNSEVDVIWMINDLDAKMPVVAQKKIPSGEWVKMSGDTALALGTNKSLYISGAGFEKAAAVINIRNLDVKIGSEGSGSENGLNWQDAPSLKKAYKGLFEIGIATTLKGELNTENGILGIGHHASSITMGNEFKPDFLFAWKAVNETVPFVAEDGNTYEMPKDLPVFNDLDTVLKIAKSTGLKIRGHVLVWHSQTPVWFFKEGFVRDSNAPYVDKATMTARQEWYIKSVLTHVAEWERDNYKNKRLIYAWDVVNEAVADNAGSQKWLRENSDWYKIYGNEEFIINAFRYANKYAPAEVQLVYNDYNCYAANKREAICNLVDKIKATPDARINAVGMQSHVKIDYPAITGYNSYEDAVKAFLAHGVDVQVTELDIANGSRKYSPVMLKSKYKDYFKLFLKYRKTEETPNGITGVTIWGVNDDGTWLNNQPEYKGHKQYPVLINGDWTVKPAFYGVLEAAESVK